VRHLLVLFVALLASGCTYSALSQRGALVATIPAAPAAECQNLGTVIGKGGGGGGLLVSNEALVEYAINDARNLAAEKGATAIVLSPPQLGGDHSGVTSATVMAIAYRCPGAAPLDAAPAPPSQPAPPPANGRAER